MASVVVRALLLLACSIFKVAAFSWQIENAITASSSYGSQALYNELASLSSSLASEKRPTATLGVVNPVETPASAFQTTLTTFTIATSAPTIVPTPVLPLEPTRSSTSAPTTIRVILTTTVATPTPTVRPVPRSIESTSITLRNEISPTNQPGSEPPHIFGSSDVPASSDEDLEFDSQLFSENVFSLLHEHLDSDYEHLDALMPYQNASDISDQESFGEDFGAFSFLGFDAAAYDESESSNSTRLNASVSLKRRWDSDDSPESDSDLPHRWKRYQKDHAGSSGHDHGSGPNNEFERPRYPWWGGHRQDEKSDQSSDRARFLKLRSLLSSLLCLLTPFDKPKQKRRRQASLDSSGSGSDDKGQTWERTPESPPEDAYDINLQPETRPISHEQLVAKVKGIYAGLVMVEAKCIEVDARQASRDAVESKPVLSHEQWQALIALHRTLLHEHHDLFLASQHLSASPALRRLASQYAIPARMWRHGIHSFLELLRHRPPHSQDHMYDFVQQVCSMLTVFSETDSEFEETRKDCLEDLDRYRMAIDDEEIQEREAWTHVARHWYSQVPNQSRDDFMRLPEDFAMRGLVWSDYFAPTWVPSHSIADDDDDWYVDREKSIQDGRRERILWLASRLANLQDPALYDQASHKVPPHCSDSTTSAVPEILFQGDIETPDLEMISLSTDTSHASFNTLNEDLNLELGEDISIHGNTNREVEIPNENGGDHSCKLDLFDEFAHESGPSSGEAAQDIPLVPLFCKDYIDPSLIPVQVPCQSFCGVENYGTENVIPQEQQSTPFEERDNAPEIPYHWNLLIPGPGIRSQATGTTESVPPDRETGLMVFEGHDFELSNSTAQQMDRLFSFEPVSAHTSTYLDELPFLQSYPSWDLSEGNLSDSDSFSSRPEFASSIESSATNFQPALGQTTFAVAESGIFQRRTSLWDDTQCILLVEPPDYLSALTSPLKTFPGPNNHSDQINPTSDTISSPSTSPRGSQDIDQDRKPRRYDRPQDHVHTLSISPSPSPSAPSKSSASRDGPIRNSFTCPHCPKSFRRQCDLNKHTPSHTRPFPCTIPQCTQSFPTKKDLNRHIHDKHSLNPSQILCKHVDCMNKEKTFKRKDNLHKHWRNVHGRNPEVWERVTSLESMGTEMRQEHVEQSREIRQKA